MLMAVPGRHWKHLKGTDSPRMFLKGTDSTWNALEVAECLWWLQGVAEWYCKGLEVPEYSRMLLTVPGRYWKHLKGTDSPRMFLKGTDSTWMALEFLNGWS